MQPMALTISRRWWVGVGLILGLVACEEEKKPQPGVTESATPQKPRAQKGEACKENGDCADLLGCAKDKTCQTYKTIECRGRDNACQIEGRCTGDGNRCIAGSEDDCKKSRFCEQDGRCSIQEGRCVAASAADCETVCKKFGRCTPEEGKCAATSAEECRAADICQGAKTCRVSNGSCLAG